MGKKQWLFIMVTVFVVLGVYCIGLLHVKSYRESGWEFCFDSELTAYKAGFFSDLNQAPFFGERGRYWTSLYWFLLQKERSSFDFELRERALPDYFADLLRSKSKDPLLTKWFWDFADRKGLVLELKSWQVDLRYVSELDAYKYVADYTWYDSSLAKDYWLRVQWSLPAVDTEHEEALGLEVKSFLNGF